jgi:hypothetical protein
MHTKTALACATLLVGALSAGSAFAQNAPATTGALAGGNGSMTCGDFLQLGHEQQASLAGSIKMNTTPSSLTSNSGGVGSASNGNNSASNMNGGGNAGSNTTIANNSNGPNGDVTNSPGNLKGSIGGNTPLTSGQLIAACQAATPTTSLEDAYAHFGTSDTGQK